jgi:site-specific DNA-cytosine methylase
MNAWPSKARSATRASWPSSTLFVGRMLNYVGLVRAIGSPDSYGFEGTRSDKVKQIANAIHVDLAEALAISALAA